MLKIINPEHFARTVRFAVDVGALDSLMKAINGLDSFMGLPDVQAVIVPDTSDLDDPCFRFALYNPKETRLLPGGAKQPLMYGGIIYSGPGRPSDGSAPNLTVSLDPDAANGAKHMWSVHT